MDRRSAVLVFVLMGLVVSASCAPRLVRQPFVTPYQSGINTAYITTGLNTPLVIGSRLDSGLDTGLVREHTSMREQDPLTGQQRMTNIETIRSMEPTGLLTH